MLRKKLVEQIQQKRSYLCVGLDTDIAKLPKHLQQHPDAIFEFNKAIIDATHDLVSSYKPNAAFYEARGAEGVLALKQTCDYLRANYPEIPIIFDAKRGDIGSTAAHYRQAFFGDARPASTLVGVKELPVPGMKVEIEAVAVLPERP